MRILAFFQRYTYSSAIGDIWSNILETKIENENEDKKKEKIMQRKSIIKDEPKIV